MKNHIAPAEWPPGISGEASDYSSASMIIQGASALCVRKQNIRVVVIISRKERREHRGRMTNEYTIQPLISTNLCVLLSRGASDPSSDSVI